MLEFIQGTKYRNPRLRYMQIMYCTLWEECKQTQCLPPPQKLKGNGYSSDVMILQSNKNKLIYQARANTYDFWLSGQYGKYNSKIFLFHPMGPFPSKMMRSPWILYFDLLTHCSTQILTLHIWRFLVLHFKNGSIPIILKKCC